MSEIPKRGPHWTRRIFAPVGICLIVAAILLLSGIGYIKAAEHWTADWRTALFSHRNASQDANVALALISEDTIADLPVRIPVDRHLTAKIIRAIASAKPAAIGIDFIYARPTTPDADADLMSAIKTAPVPIVLGTVNENANLPERQLAWHRKFIADAGRDAGHVFFERKLDPFAISDQTIRNMAHSATLGGVPSLALVLARLIRPDARPYNATIAWLLPALDGSQPFYEVDAADIIGPPEDSAPLLAGLAGKIVLLGSDLVDVDRHLTPLSVTNEARVPGVVIHAQILAQLIDGRSIEPLTRAEEVGLLFAMAALGYLLSRQPVVGQFAKALGFFGSALLVLTGFAVFKYFGYILPYTTALAAWVAGISFGRKIDHRYERLSKVRTLFGSKGRFSWRVFHRLGSMALWR